MEVGFRTVAGFRAENCRVRGLRCEYLLEEILFWEKKLHVDKCLRLGFWRDAAAPESMFHGGVGGLCPTHGTPGPTGLPNGGA